MQPDNYDDIRYEDVNSMLSLVTLTASILKSQSLRYELDLKQLVELFNEDLQKEIFGGKEGIPASAPATH